MARYVRVQGSACKLDPSDFEEEEEEVAGWFLSSCNAVRDRTGEIIVEAATPMLAVAGLMFPKEKILLLLLSPLSLYPISWSRL